MRKVVQHCYEYYWQWTYGQDRTCMLPALCLGTWCWDKDGKIHSMHSIQSRQQLLLSLVTNHCLIWISLGTHNTMAVTCPFPLGVYKPLHTYYNILVKRWWQKNVCQYSKGYHNNMCYDVIINRQKSLVFSLAYIQCTWGKWSRRYNPTPNSTLSFS